VIGAVGALAVIPTYNEADNIAAPIGRVLAQDGVGGVIVVDDGSPDGTGDVVDRLAASDTTRIEAIHRPRKAGLGTAYKAGFARALERNADCVLTLDADWSHPPEAIPQLLARNASHELVIGSRYVPGGEVRNWGLERRLLSRGANAVARGALGLTTHDCTAGFRCYSAHLLRCVDWAAVRSSDYAFLIELLYMCQRANARIAEVPIVFEDRRHGASKISRTEVWRALGTVAALSVRRWQPVRATESNSQPL
jgi:dolichol-phosphate mannosyltransferase